MSSPNPKPDDLGFELDLDSARAARAEVTTVPKVTIGGKSLLLPPELPLDVLEPLTRINVDISVLIRQVLDMRRDAGEAANEAILDAVVDMLVVNPALPTEVVEAVKEMARRLFGGEGYAHLVSQRLFVKDIGAIAKFVAQRYGVGLGEASRSSDSAEATGTTSKPTSPVSTPESTSATSGEPQTTPAS